MMSNKTLGYCLISSVIVGVVAVMAEIPFPQMSDFLYGIAGIMWVVFSVWGGKRLIELDIK